MSVTYKNDFQNEVWIESAKAGDKGTSEKQPLKFDVNDPYRPPRLPQSKLHWNDNPAEQEEIRSAPLTTIPEPGLAVLPDLVDYSAKPRERKLIMKPNWKNKGFDVVDITDNLPQQAMLKIANPSPKLLPNSAKRVFSNANSATKLCIFDKEMVKLRTTYRVTDPNTKNPLVEVIVKQGSESITATLTVLAARNSPEMGSTSASYDGFSNEIIDGTETTAASTSKRWSVGRKSVVAANFPMLEYKGHATELRGMIQYQGSLAATIEHKFFVTSSEYHLRIAPGLDPLLICVLAMAVEHKRRGGESVSLLGSTMGGTGG